jgi:uncharacterized protein with PIN domain
MLGYDAVYLNEVSDDTLLAISTDERRILLTKDLALYRRAKSRGLDTCFAEGRSTASRLANIAKRYPIRLKVDPNLSRCPLCNSRLKVTGKREILHRVPHGTLNNYDKYWLCTGCEKIYWHGSHWKKINETLRMARMP